MMKAWTVKEPGSLESLQLVDLADPGAPTAGEIQAALHATLLNYHDLLVATGVVPTANRRVLMADDADVVEAVGAGVDEFQSDGRVVASLFPQWLDGHPDPLMSGFSQTPGDDTEGFAYQYVVKPASHFTRAPERWNFREAATITTSSLTTWRALVVERRLRAGDAVLVLGTGGVSITALQLAKSMGAQVIVTSSSGGKLARICALGTNHLINYRTTPAWGAAVQDITGHRGADLTLELGGPGTLGQPFEAVSTGGHIALIGTLTGFEGHIPTRLLMSKQTRSQGLMVDNRRQQQGYVNALNLQASWPIISKVFDFTTLPDAFRYLQSGAHFGRICME